MSSAAHNTIHVQGGSEARTVDMSKHKEMGSGRPFASTVGIECTCPTVRDVDGLVATSSSSLRNQGTHCCIVR